MTDDWRETPRKHRSHVCVSPDEPGNFLSLTWKPSKNKNLDRQHVGARVVHPIFRMTSVISLVSSAVDCFFFPFLHTSLILHITYSNYCRNRINNNSSSGEDEHGRENKTADKKGKNKIMILNLRWICGRIPPNISHPLWYCRTWTPILGFSDILTN